MSISLWNAYENGDFTDLTIECGEEIFKVHKLIFCTHSPVFRSMCQNPSQESTESIIRLDDDEVHIATFRAALEWLYTGQYCENFDPGTDSASYILSNHALVYAFADKYEMQELGTYAVQKYGVCLSTLTNKRTPDENIFADVPVKIWIDFLDSVDIIYNADNSGSELSVRMRKLAVKTARTCGTYMRRLAPEEVKKSFDMAMVYFPEFCQELAFDALDHPLVECTRCYKVDRNSLKKEVCTECKPLLAAHKHPQVY